MAASTVVLGMLAYSCTPGMQTKAWSCPRDVRLLASWGFDWGISWNPSDITALWYWGFEGGLQLGSHYVDQNVSRLPVACNYFYDLIFWRRSSSIVVVESEDESKFPKFHHDPKIVQGSGIISVMVPWWAPRWETDTRIFLHRTKSWKEKYFRGKFFDGFCMVYYYKRQKIITKGEWYLDGFAKENM